MAFSLFLQLLNDGKDVDADDVYLRAVIRRYLEHLRLDYPEHLFDELASKGVGFGKPLVERYLVISLRARLGRGGVASYLCDDRFDRRSPLPAPIRRLNDEEF